MHPGLRVLVERLLGFSLLGERVVGERELV
jgi:hypothetical protein